MTDIAIAPGRRSPAATKAEGAVRTARTSYYFNGAGPWPGVTSVTKVLDAPALTYWKMNQVAQAAIASAEQLIRDREAGKTDAAVKYLTTLSTTAMDRGSRIHASIEQILRREPVSIDPRDEAAVAGARAWLNAQVREHGLRPLEVEAFLLHETLGYGGTCDLIAELDGEVWLLDWKTGRQRRHPRRHRVPRPPAPAGGLRERGVHRPGQRPGAVPAPRHHPLRTGARHRRRHPAVRGLRHPARLGRVPSVSRAARLEQGEGGVSIDRVRLAGCSIAVLAVLGFWTLVVAALWCLCRLVWP